MEPAISPNRWTLKVSVLIDFPIGISIVQRIRRVETHLFLPQLFPYIIVDNQGVPPFTKNSGAKVLEVDSLGRTLTYNGPYHKMLSYPTLSSAVSIL